MRRIFDMSAGAPLWASDSPRRPIEVTVKILLTVASVVLRGTALAQDAPYVPIDVVASEQSPASVDAEYKAVIAEATTEYDAQHWTQAGELFQRAHALRPSARTLRGLGLVELNAQHYPIAYRYLSLALENARKPLAAEQRREVEDVLTRIEAFVGRYTLQREPSYAVLHVDGASAVSAADGSIVLETGAHELTATAPNFVDWQKHIDVVGGHQEVLHIVLVARAVAQTPAPLPVLSAVQTPSPKPAADSGQLTRWLLVGGGAVCIVAGATLFVLGLNDISTVEGVRDGKPYREIEGADKRAPVLTGTGVALSVIGVASTVTGIVWQLTQNKLEREPGARLAITPQGVQLRGEF
jgi:hypothetical protein